MVEDPNSTSTNWPKDYSNYELMSKMTAVLHNSITVENCDQILIIASDYDIEDLSTKVLEFIDNNFNQWIIGFIPKGSKSHLYRNQFNDKTMYRLLEVLTNNTLPADINQVKFDINGRVVPVIKDIVYPRHKLKELRVGDQEVITIEDTTFEAFQTIVSYLYFNRLLLKDKTIIDLQLIREVCKLAKRYRMTFLLNDIKHYLEFNKRCITQMIESLEI